MTLDTSRSRQPPPCPQDRASSPRGDLPAGGPTPPGVAGLPALVLLVTAAGLSGILWSYGEAVRQGNAAQSEAEQTRFLQGDISTLRGIDRVLRIAEEVR
jgi:hypothetical protein